ncbi:MAG: hypothetical protein JXR69_05425 [Candidatus Delongbacteria bacterium]|nr:hypothetical protein [Candidatus Delongbacteria bacterium]
MYFPLNTVLEQVELSNRSNYTDKENIETTIQRILDHYSRSGFPLCEVKIKDVKEYDGNTVCELEINSGEYVRISFIEFDGNNICDANYLIKESRLILNSKFNENEVKNAINYLYKTRLFYSKPEYSLVSKNNKTGLKIVLKEKKYFKGMFIGGVNNSDESSEFYGSGQFTADNILGTNRKAGIEWTKKANNNEKFHFMYREPFTFSLPVSNRITFEQENKNLLFLRRNYEIYSDWSIDPETDIVVSYNHENIYPDSANTEIISDVVTNTYKGGLEYSTLYDEMIIPRYGGYSISAGFSSVNTEFIENDSTYSAVEVELKFKKVFNNFNGIYIISNSVYEQILSSDKIDNFNKIVFGGVYGLRGYSDESFLTDIKLISEIEVIYSPLSDLAFGSFLDIAGYNSDQGKIKKLNDLSVKYGYGVILSYVKSSNEVQFTIGIPGDKGFSGSMVHVRYSYRF